MVQSKKRKLPKSQRQKISASLEEYYTDEGNRTEFSRLMKKRYSNPAARRRMSEIMKQKYLDSHAGQNLADKRKDYWKLHPKEYNKYRENARKVRSASSYRKKISKIIKENYRKNPELIAKVDRAVTQWWEEHPNIRKERSEEMRNLFIKNPDKFKGFMKFGNNSADTIFKTKQKFNVRSRGEQQIADFLWRNKIKAFYEAKPLTFEKEGQICVPDFWLPKYKTYIEYYGGHPKSWKKKVMKNKLYKKYNISCIFITPTELRDLDYYLKRELLLP